MGLTDVEEFDQGWTVGDTIYFLKGDRFDGPWDAERQVMHGQGVYYWRDGRKFEGSFMNGIKQGEGQYWGTDLSKYIGEFNDDKIEGFGVIGSDLLSWIFSQSSQIFSHERN